jgi:hypothetical protein
MPIGNHRITIEDVIRHLTSTGVLDHEVQEGSYYAIGWLTATANANSSCLEESSITADIIRCLHQNPSTHSEDAPLMSEPQWWITGLDNIKEKEILPLPSGAELLPSQVGHDTGDPQVFFHQPIPAPMNTVPIWVRVWVPPQVCVGHHGFVGFAAGFCSILCFLYIIKYINNKLSTLTIIQTPLLAFGTREGVVVHAIIIPVGFIAPWCPAIVVVGFNTYKTLSVKKEMNKKRKEAP